MGGNMLVVSACLAGRACRYDGGSSTSQDVARLVELGQAVCVCPECMGGLPVPREPSEIAGGDGHAVLGGCAKVLSISGKNVTAEFLRGAKAALQVALAHGATGAILKAKSPSCGEGRIYSGKFNGELKPGDGVLAALFKQHGIWVETR